MSLEKNLESDQVDNPDEKSPVQELPRCADNHVSNRSVTNVALTHEHSDDLKYPNEWKI